jgi:hypothetical protein
MLRAFTSRAPPLRLDHPSRATTFTVPTMTAIYRPTEAIALLRPSFLLPRIQPSSTRKTALGRTAFSTSRNAQATHSPSPGPPPPQRKSITLTGDTGQVRWSDLSPGEKAVRTTQQSFNLVVVVVGILATVSSPHVPSHESYTKNDCIGRRRLLSLLRRLLPFFQDRPIQSRRNPHPRRFTMSSAARSVIQDCSIR